MVCARSKDNGLAGTGGLSLTDITARESFLRRQETHELAFDLGCVPPSHRRFPRARSGSKMPPEQASHAVETLFSLPQGLSTSLLSPREIGP